MKYALLFIALAMTGCASETPYGKCVGLGDDKDPQLVYKPSVRNLIVGAVFVELIAPPIYVAVDQFYCPVGKKNDKA